MGEARARSRAGSGFRAPPLAAPGASFDRSTAAFELDASTIPAGEAVTSTSARGPRGNRPGGRCDRLSRSSGGARTVRCRAWMGDEVGAKQAARLLGKVGRT
jgi:hypothetical protein